MAVLIALFDAGFGLAMLFVADQAMVWHLSLVAAYTGLRGIFELLMGFRTTVDPTDRFIWALCGVVGIIFGLVIFNSGHLENIEFMRFFGAYMMILGVCSLIYGIHNHEQGIEDREARSIAAKKAIKTKTSKSTRKN